MYLSAEGKFSLSVIMRVNKRHQRAIIELAQWPLVSYPCFIPRLYQTQDSRSTLRLDGLWRCQGVLVLLILAHYRLERCSSLAWKELQQPTYHLRPSNHTIFAAHHPCS